MNDYQPVRSLMRCLTASFPLARADRPNRVALHERVPESEIELT